MNLYTKNQTPEEKLEFLRKAQNELVTYQNMMTAYERHAISEELLSKREEYYGEIAGHYIQKFEQALDCVKRAQARVKKAMENEINRWDSAKLSNELSFYEGQFARAMAQKMNPLFDTNSLGAVAKVFEEAIASNDIYKQRATCELVRNLDVRVSGNNLSELASIRSRAKSLLNALRQTDEIASAIKNLDNTVHEMQPVQAELLDVARVLGINTNNIFADDGISRVLNRVRIDPKTNEIIILEHEDPKVSGIESLKEKQSEVDE